MIENPDLANTESKLRSVKTAQTLDPTAAYLRRLMPQMSFDGVSYGRAKIRR